MIGAALIAFVCKLALACNTFGTNDVTSFLHLRPLSSLGTDLNGLIFAEQKASASAIFNHPPVTAYFARLSSGLPEQVFKSSGITFPFLLRFPASWPILLLLSCWLGYPGSITISAAGLGAYPRTPVPCR